jgi:hypothetical protein
MGTGIVLTVVAALAVLAVRHIYKEKKSGRGCCGGSCGGCAHAGACHPRKED